MKPLVVHEIFLIIGAVNLVHSIALPDFTTVATPETNITLEEAEKLLLECKNPDYRTYIKCLKRQKRQHHRPGEHGDFDHQCLESCLEKCSGANHEECDKKCAHCLKKTRHRHQIITEYETECTSGECRRKDSDTAGLPVTNITTTIDINNIINTDYNRTCCPTCTPPTPCHPIPGPQPPPWPPHNPYPHPYPPYPPHPPYPYPPVHPPYTPYGPYGPQLTLVPQLTLGLGLGFTGGFSGAPCSWPPCAPFDAGTNRVDCSVCSNPFLKYKCDISCRAEQKDPRPANPCQSPHCVGGMQ